MALIARITTCTLTCTLACLAALAGLVMLSSPAHAEDGFRYWGYYHLTDGTWEASKKGPSGYTAADGAVEGLRFASTTATDPSRPPRALPTFEDLCAQTEAAAGEKRIGIVLDYGTTQDAAEGADPPPAEGRCAVVPAGANTQQALESVAPLRIEGGLVCAIDGYPASGCGDEVKDVAVPADEKPVDLALPGEGQASGDGGVPWPLVGIGAVVVVLGSGAVVVARKRT